MLSVISFFFLFRYQVSAQTINYRIPNPSNIDSLEELINLGASLIQPAFLLAFGAMILFGGFNILTSQGDSGKIETGKKTIIAAIIGFVISVLAPQLINLVTSALGVQGLS